MMAIRGGWFRLGRGSEKGFELPAMQAALLLDPWLSWLVGQSVRMLFLRLDLGMDRPCLESLFARGCPLLVCA